jgi:hypothetical protein
MESQISVTKRPTAPSLTMERATAKRTVFIDNLRAALPALVICQHAAITYSSMGPADRWYWVPAGAEPSLIMTVFAVINQDSP